MSKQFTFANLIFSDVDIKKRSDQIINYFLPAFFLLGLLFATFYGTWLIAIGVGGLSLAAYYIAKIALPGSALYQYILSIVLGIFMAQFIYQMHGLFEMHFFVFIGSSLLVTYQKWKLQLPLLLFVILHHAILSQLQNAGVENVYFTQLDVFDNQTFIIHILLTIAIVFISALIAFQLHKYHYNQVLQTRQMMALQAEAQRNMEQRKNQEAMKEKSTILESIGDAFFAVDKDWIVNYWNNMAEKVLGRSKEQMLNHNLWTVFAEATDSISFKKYREAIDTGQPMHFEDYYPPLGKWHEVSAYPSANGLSVYLKDITARKLSEEQLKDSEKRYSDLFHLSPLANWVIDFESLRILDANKAAISNYGYTHEEFLNMTIKDILPATEVPQLLEILDKYRLKELMTNSRGITHCKKNGELMLVSVQSTEIQYKGRKSCIFVANDITESANYVKAIELQNKKLTEISWMQSHVIRAPLSRIMGLVSLLDDADMDETELNKIKKYIQLSANELDVVIHKITDKTSVIDL